MTHSPMIVYSLARVASLLHNIALRSTGTMLCVCMVERVRPSRSQREEKSIPDSAAEVSWVYSKGRSTGRWVYHPSID